jgi:uncharacterized protein
VPRKKAESKAMTADAPRKKAESKGATDDAPRIQLGATPLEIDVGEGQHVSGLLTLPGDAFALLVLAHGAGAGMKHPFMEDVSRRLAARGVATLRYQFLYMEAGKSGPDRPPALVRVVRAAVKRASEYAPELPLFAGGKSMGGRMTSTAAAEAGWTAASEAKPNSPTDTDPPVQGIVFFGFPLHAPGKPGSDRAAHLADARVPMLFLQGTRDDFAKLDLLEPVVKSLGKNATIEIIDDADHSFNVRKSSGQTTTGVLDRLCDATAGWMRERV